GVLVVAVIVLGYLAFKPKTDISVSPTSVTPSGQTTTLNNPTGKDYQPQSNASSGTSISANIAGWKIYTNSKYGFSLQYPQSFSTDANKAASGDFDGIDTSNMFLVNYPTESFKGTNLASATIFAGVKNVDENTCFYTLYGNSTNNETITQKDTVVVKNGITYHYVSSTEGAAGSSYSTYRYSTMHNNTCYQLYLVAHSSNNIEESGVTRYNPQKTILPIFNQLVGSLAFSK
ncbi:MAG TPA: hypothetical protein VF941_16285, partial [Clostridia bacterium]